MHLRYVLFLAVFAPVVAFEPAWNTQESDLAALHGKVLRAAVAIESATGFAVWKSETTTYFLTAYHVIDDNPKPSVTSYSAGSFTTRMGRVVAIDPLNDLALVSVESTDYEILAMASNQEYLDSVVPGRVLLAAGWPRTRPALVTVGVVRDPVYTEEERGPFLFHSAGGWFGFSGGPIVSVALGKACGLTIEIRGEWGAWDSSMMIAVPAPTINKFLETARKP